MERLFSILAGVAVAMILVAGVGIYAASAVMLNQARLEASAANASTIVQGLAKRIQFIEESLDGMANDPDVIATLNSADKTALSALSSRLEKYVPGARKIRLIPVGIIEQDTTDVPRMGFGDVDMVKAAFQDNPPAAIQGDAGPDRHLAVSRRIVQNKQAIGVILASLDFSFIAQSMKEAEAFGDYYELRQTKLSLGNNAKPGDPDADLNKLAVPGTSWELHYAEPGLAGGGLVLVIALILLPVLLALGAVYIVYRQLSEQLAQDQDWLLKAFKDLLTNQPKGSYPVLLNGMNGLVASMMRFNREVELKGVDAVTRNQDDFELEGYFDELSDAAKDISQQIDDADKLTQKMIVEEIAPPPQQPKPKKPAVTETPQTPPAAVPDVADKPLPPVLPFDKVFGVYDIRGIAGQTLSESLVKDIGRAFGSQAMEQGCKLVVLGRDGRLSSPSLANALAEGVISTGCHVLDIGMVPTPVLYFVVQHSEGRTGIMLTGSHNPPEHNGMKMMVKGETLLGDRIQQIRKRIETQAFVKSAQPGTVERNSMFLGEYIGTLCEDIQVSRELKVVLDCGNGVTGEIAPKIFAELGCEVVPLHCEVDGEFPHHQPDPRKPENLADLIQAVRTNQADIGLAFDGDGDRLGVVDSNGKIILPDRQMMLFAKDVLAGKPGSEIIYDVKCSRNLASQIVKFGGRPLMWKTGHSFIKAKLKETGAKLAGEMSGHIFFNDRWFGFDDAMYAAARLLQVLSEDGRSSAQLFEDFPDSLNTPELNVILNEGENVRVVEALLAAADFAGGKITNIDGMRIDFSDGWGLVRASNTTPSLVIRFEADSRDALLNIQAQFRELLLKVKPDLKLPF
jgi:phosphomannomutase / phosphoglucomutase